MGASAQTSTVSPKFVPSLLGTTPAAGGQAIAWADFDNDGDLDLAVGFKDAAARLYRYHDGEFSRAASIPALEHVADYRSLSWGDFNGDGYADLYVGFGRDSSYRNLLLVGSERGFSEQGQALGVNARGTSRQANWIDYDSDGDSDLFVAMRDRSSKLYRNDGDKFTDVSRESGLADPRRSVGAAWFDFDQDGDLDLFLPNQSGDRDALYRNDGGRFVDIAGALEMDRARRPLQEGSVGATVCDINGDGFLDIFVPVYGPDMLWISNGSGGFSNEAATWGVNDEALAVGAECGDLNNDGRNDLVVVAYERGLANGHDRFYLNLGNRLVDHFPDRFTAFDGDHGVRLADYDDDGDLDMATTNRHPEGKLTLWTNQLPQSNAGRYLKVWVLDHAGNYTRQGDEVRAYDAETGELIASALVDTGGGYISQSMQPVHLGLGDTDRVRLEVTSPYRNERILTVLEGVDPNQTVTIRVVVEPRR